MDVQKILDAIDAGVRLYHEADDQIGQLLPPQVEMIAKTGVGIIEGASKLYAHVKADLSAADQASVDAALTAAATRTGADVDRFLAEAAADRAAGIV